MYIINILTYIQASLYLRKCNFVELRDIYLTNASTMRFYQEGEEYSSIVVNLVVET